MNEQQTLNSWEKLYIEIKKQYLDTIPLKYEAQACHDFNHGIVKDMPKLEYPT